MKLYHYDPVNFGFIVLSTDEHNIAQLRATANSIKKQYGTDTSVICVVPACLSKDDIKEIKEICPVYQGENTITSLINLGMKKGHKEWNILVMEGVYVNIDIVKKLFTFAESEKEILYPIVTQSNRRVQQPIRGQKFSKKWTRPVKITWAFEDSTLNGIAIHADAFKEIGDFTCRTDSLVLSKLEWRLYAEAKGYRFKAILGAKIC